MSLELRPATSADLDAVVAVFLACWQESYRGVLPDSTVDAMDLEKARMLWERALGSDDGEVLVAEAAGTVLGVTRLAVNGADGVVHSLYVTPRSQGSGLGSQLLSAASSRLAELGALVASLWVFAANAPSLAFYRRHGWLADGGQRTQDDFGELEVRLVRRLGRGDEITVQSTLQALADQIVGIGPAGVVLGLSFQGQRTTVASGVARRGDAQPMTVGTAHDLASVTKVVGTTAAVMRLVSDGALSLDSTAESVLPRFAGHAGTTIRDLLQHQAGLWEWQPLYLSPEIGEGATAVLERIAPRYPLRSGRHYSDLGFLYLGLIIEAVTGRSLNDAMHELVFAPLGMRETSFAAASSSVVAASSIGDRAERTMVSTGEPYPVSWSGLHFEWRERELVGEVNDGNCFHAFNGVAGHAGLFSTVDDLLTFAEALGNPGRPAQPWTSGVAAEFFAPSPEPSQALGFRRTSIGIRGRQHPLLWHPGFTGCAVGFVPSLGMGIALASNRLLTGAPPVATTALWNRLVDVAVDLHSSTTTPRTS